MGVLRGVWLFGPGYMIGNRGVQATRPEISFRD